MDKIRTTKSTYLKELSLSAYHNYMKAAQLTAFRSPLRITSVKLPPLGPREIAVQIYTAGINFYELMVINGTYPILPTLPITPGGELAGVIIDIGKEITSFKKGDRVFSLAQTGKGTTGSYAQVAHVEEKYLYHLPDSLSFEEGTSFPMTGFTAYTMLTKRVHMPPRGIILVHSAAGGVGSMLVQLIKILFPRTIIVGTCSDEKKVHVIRNLGADVIVNIKEKSFTDQIRTTFPDGLDVIFDPTGQQYFDDNLHLLRSTRGVLCSYGIYTGPITDPNVVGKLRKNNLTLSGFLMWPLLEDKIFCQKIFTHLFRLMDGKKLVPLIDNAFSLRNVNDALERMKKRENIGKILIKT